VAIAKDPLTIVGHEKRAGGVALSQSEIDYVDEVRVVDFAANPTGVTNILEGCHIVIHLAALPKPWESFENVVRTNIMGDYLFYKEAVRAKVRRFVYASTNHVQHGATMRTTPETLDSRQFGAHVASFVPLQVIDKNSLGY
jgi:nucleoside-diphosphate-sugar epimerase